MKWKEWNGKEIFLDIFVASNMLIKIHKHTINTQTWLNVYHCASTTHSAHTPYVRWTTIGNHQRYIVRWWKWLYSFRCFPSFFKQLLCASKFVSFFTRISSRINWAMPAGHIIRKSPFQRAQIFQKYTWLWYILRFFF